ncbi:hypothetical protein XELAEV_18019330mg [Xenopus laevis]|uniref:Uncharacterized protein n=1 Tax=Xenopus laevis TaxID=8355 RepID=A0A974DEU4_XENLA|nr:hypothetical protein XELAEV_18019330mg [Xenopus laevis]
MLGLKVPNVMLMWVAEGLPSGLACLFTNRVFLLVVNFMVSVGILLCGFCALRVGVFLMFLSLFLYLWPRVGNPFIQSPMANTSMVNLIGSVQSDWCIGSRSILDPEEKNRTRAVSFSYLY